MYSLLRAIMFRVNPEKAHYWAMDRLQQTYKLPGGRALLRQLFCRPTPSLARTFWGITFPNPVGLAAGFDKDARWTDALSCLGFGFIEIGTVTPRPQPGNPKPRLFRLKEDKALINRMGFNNGGSSTAATRLQYRKEKVIIGGNIGKNKDTPNEDALLDYERAFRDLYAQVDYFVVNVSSPNTPGLRELQEKEPLQALLSRLQKVNVELGTPKPLLLKIAPDLTNGQLDDIIDLVKTLALDGIVATNTTIDRSNLRGSVPEEAGGLSGQPLKGRSLEVLRYLVKGLEGKVPIIAAGGIATAEDAQAALDAGAALVQIYTSFIYEGPAVVRRICAGLQKKVAI